MQEPSRAFGGTKSSNGALPQLNKRFQELDNGVREALSEYAVLYATVSCLDLKSIWPDIRQFFATRRAFPLLLVAAGRRILDLAGQPNRAVLFNDPSGGAVAAHNCSFVTANRQPAKANNALRGLNPLGHVGDPGSAQFTLKLG